MASLKDIRRRISSVKNTQQITKAMKMVAAAKLRRAQLAIAGARPYAEKLEETSIRLVAEIMEGYGAADEATRNEILARLHPLLKTGSVAEGAQAAKSKVALFVMASDRGLCGAYNTNVLRFGWKRLQTLRQEGVEVSLFFAGKRANEYFIKRGYPGHFFADYWAGRFTNAKSDAVANLFIEKFLAGEFDRVEVCFTHFKSGLTQVPELKQVLPMVVPTAVVDSGTSKSFIAPFIYEPNRQEILAAALPKQVKTQIYRVAAESLASEFSAKLTAMDNATRNASEMIARLTLESNRVRQANITKELMEIIGGAEAIKG